MKISQTSKKSVIIFRKVYIFAVSQFFEICPESLLPCLTLRGPRDVPGRVRWDARANVPSRSSLFPGNGGPARGSAAVRPPGLRLQERTGTSHRDSLFLSWAPTSRRDAPGSLGPGGWGGDREDAHARMATIHPQHRETPVGNPAAFLTTLLYAQPPPSRDAGGFSYLSVCMTGEISYRFASSTEMQ